MVWYGVVWYGYGTVALIFSSSASIVSARKQKGRNGRNRGLDGGSTVDDIDRGGIRSVSVSVGLGWVGLDTVI
jgi:hypothetical protein